MRCYAAAAAWCDVDCLQLCSFTRISYGRRTAPCHWSRRICRFGKLNWYLWFVLFFSVAAALTLFIYLHLFTCVLFSPCFFIIWRKRKKSSLHLSIKAHEQYTETDKMKQQQQHRKAIAFIFTVGFFSAVYLICLMLEQTLKKVQRELDKITRTKRKGTDSTFKKNVFCCL